MDRLKKINSLNTPGYLIFPFAQEGAKQGRQNLSQARHARLCTKDFGLLNRTYDLLRYRRLVFSLACICAKTH